MDGVICHPLTSEHRCQLGNVCADGAPGSDDRELVRSGREQNAGKVLDDGLRLVEHREAEAAAKLDDLRAAAGVGVAASIEVNSKNSGDIEDLQAYLNNLSDRIISRTAE